MGQLKYQGCCLFRQRVVASLLCGHPLKVEKIREKEESPGLQDFEANFLRLIEKLTDGTKIEINETGTTLRVKPGILGGGNIVHDCGTSRAIGWFVEAIIPLLVFSKNDVNLSLTGITNDAVDLSVDVLRDVTFPLLQNFGIYNATIKIKQRGAAPKGGGIVEIHVPIIRALKPVYIVEEGLVKRIRGTAFCTKISPTIVTRVIDSCRGVLNQILPDVHINTDHFKGKDGGDSPGYSLALVAETTTGALLSVERTANTRPQGSSSAATPVLHQAGELPEDIGKDGAYMILDEITSGGVVDRAHQCLMLQLMVLTPEDVSKIRFGMLTMQSMEMLRLLKETFGVVFKIKEEYGGGALIQPVAPAAAEEQDEDVADEAETSNMKKKRKRKDRRGMADTPAVPSKYSRAESTKEQRNSEVQPVDRTRTTLLLSCFGIGYSNVNRRVT